MGKRSSRHERAERQLGLKDGRRVWLRTVESSDAELFLGFFEGLSAQSRDYMHGWSARCDRKHAESIVARADTSDYYGLVATVPAASGERIVGYSWIDGLEGAETPMLGIGIIDEFHNVGLGSALLRTMIDEASRLELKRVKLGVWADNSRALYVYESVGFRRDPALPSKDFEGRIEHYMVVEASR